ncbi:putative F-box protein PP2-B12 [Juglans microcarpa x Juglans regia]|uniref:putative F-box protein PP2-B12 n=1 Tax=Juglans microcarpa x Juglans regia TaxID=2249226 RepID=UPI001B7E91CE|nr:putative F-box protein PP2-B12 [Juglans microcarpa x Juglans regia]
MPVRVFLTHFPSIQRLSSTQKTCKRGIRKGEMETDMTRILPEECIANIISNTSPRDACRVSLVSRAFKTAAASNLVWERFLPPDYRNIIFPSVSSEAASSSSSSLNMLPKKDLYFHLCNNPTLIGNGNRTFAINKWSGKKCYMLGARELSISWGDTEYYWQWISSADQSPDLPKSRFSEVAHLWLVWWLEIRGSVETKILSPNTTYGAYFIYTIAPMPKNSMHYRAITSPLGLSHPVKVSLSIENEIEGETTNIAYLQPRTSRDRPPGHDDGRLPCKREDMWMEIEIGEFFNGDENNVLQMHLWETEAGQCKSGLVVHGIELRPKEEKNY